MNDRLRALKLMMNDIAEHAITEIGECTTLEELATARAKYRKAIKQVEKWLWSKDDN